MLMPAAVPVSRPLCPPRRLTTTLKYRRKTIVRVIAGTARSLRLKTPEGLGTRPTTDRIKETLFNILQPFVGDAVFLDLFCGSGGIGIEALSRGAKRAYFVEQDRRVVRYVRDNLEFTGFGERAVVLAQDVRSVFPRIREEEVDIIFMDPPYGLGLEREVLEVLSGEAFVTHRTLIVAEAALGTDFSYVPGLGFEVLREKRYKTNMHVLIRRKI